VGITSSYWHCVIARGICYYCHYLANQMGYMQSVCIQYILCYSQYYYYHEEQVYTGIAPV